MWKQLWPDSHKIVEISMAFAVSSFYYYYSNGTLMISFCETELHAPIPMPVPAGFAVPVIWLTTISFGAIGGHSIATYSPSSPAFSIDAGIMFSRLKFFAVSLFFIGSGNLR